MLFKEGKPGREVWTCLPDVLEPDLLRAEHTIERLLVRRKEI
jgi:hypothetical protein